MIRALGTTFALLVAAVAAAPPEPVRPTLVYPHIKDAGGVALLPKAPYQPKAEAKVLFDITVAAKPADVNKGLDRVARLINLYAGHGVPPDGLQVVVVLHGSAIDSALTDAAYQRRTGAVANPNLPLLRQLHAAAVKVYVCGQTLAQKGYSHQELAAPLEVAVSAMLVNVQSQNDGYAVLGVH